MQTIIELLRRVLALAGLLVGAWAFFWPGPPLLVVAPVDFRHDFEKRITTTKEDLADPQAFADFKAYRTKDRTVDVSGREWLELAGRLREPGPELEQRMTSGGARPRFVFLPQDKPFDALAPLRDFQYLRIAAPGGEATAWLAVSLQPRQDILGLPHGWGHPWRGLGLILAAGGILAYALLPRRKPGPDELRYGRFASVMGADILGLLLAAMFGILPLLVVWSNDPAGSVFPGWLALALPLWLMAALGLVLLGVGTRYALLAWRVDKDGLVKIVGGSETRYPWADMDRAEPYAGRAGRIIGTLLLLFGRTPGQTGQGILVAANEAYGVRVHMKDGRSFKVMANHLDGFDDILNSTQKNISK